ncbi:bifunctional AP-4-A phosphorylase/ADP sulfurylase [Lithohypha guttulata]|uniref:bifunctional AP-4-A phosphorylase/ADP sulfurylase n=1 Tax=Lithohypha guttulata TaxID=1690604 RepID=UPI002DE15113|nr:hypothetical protein LTR51_006146 [Lithohypha guttulata]
MISRDESESSLEARALAQFDSLVEKGEVFWEPTEEIRYEQKPFDVYFRISPITNAKPYNPNDKSRKPGFLDDDPEFTLCKVAPNHKLILNKYCWLRPQLILHTLDFQSQKDMLTQADFHAASEVLKQLGDRYMIIFNGGPDAGSSVAHKHLQVFPRPERRTVVEDLLENPELMLPFRYELAKLDENTKSEDIYNHYKSMCNKLAISNGTPQSLVLVKEWLIVLPRTCATIKGEIEGALMQGGANAMIGMLWLKTPEQFENWKKYGPMKVLTEFGVTTKTD